MWQILKLPLRLNIQIFVDQSSPQIKVFLIQVDATRICFSFTINFFLYSNISCCKIFQIKKKTLNCQMTTSAKKFSRLMGKSSSLGIYNCSNLDMF